MAKAVGLDELQEIEHGYIYVCDFKVSYQVNVQCPSHRVSGS